MTAEDAARQWARTWARGWTEHDVDAIAALYAEGATFRSSPFRKALVGPAGVREYATWAFADEERAEPRFGEPVVAGRPAAVEWWGVSTVAGEETTIVGASLLWFDELGLVVAQHDYWSSEPGRRKPHEDFGRSVQG